jgi:hypothetical protein
MAELIAHVVEEISGNWIASTVIDSCVLAYENQLVHDGRNDERGRDGQARLPHR